MASWPDGTDLQPAVAVLGDLGGVVPLDSLDHHPGRGVAWEDPARREIFPFGRERLEGALLVSEDGTMQRLFSATIERW
jgi:hypothetical protein